MRRLNPCALTEPIFARSSNKSVYRWPLLPGLAPRLICLLIVVGKRVGERRLSTFQILMWSDRSWPVDRGRKRRSPSPPSEPGVQFSRIK
jgi:hypothetical protein